MSAWNVWDVRRPPLWPLRPSDRAPLSCLMAGSPRKLPHPLYFGENEMNCKYNYLGHCLFLSPYSYCRTLPPSATSLVLTTMSSSLQLSIYRYKTTFNDLSSKRKSTKGPVIIYRVGGGGAEDFIRRTKGGINRNWETKRGDHWKLWKDSRGPTQICLKMKTWEGDRERHQMLSVK